MREKLTCLLPALMALAWDAHATQCLATQMGDPCAQGGIATMGAARSGPDFGIGNPVDRRSGNKYQRDTDMPALWSAPGLELVRHYNAMDPRRGPLGRGWTWSYDTRLYQMPDGIQIVQADGSRLDFSCAAAGPLAPGCRAADPLHGRIRVLADGWRWRWPQGTALRFDRDGRLTQVDHGVHGRIEIRRHLGGWVPEGAPDEVIAHPSGARLRFRYGEAGGHPILSAVETPAGTFRYRVELSGGSRPRLTAVTRPDGMQRRYHHEPAFQSGHADALTGISIASADGAHALRSQSWRYDATGRANAFIPGAQNESPVGLPIAFDDHALGLDARHDVRGQLRVLLADRVDHIMRRQLVCLELLGVDPHAQIRVDITTKHDLAHTR